MWITRNVAVANTPVASLQVLDGFVGIALTMRSQKFKRQKVPELKFLMRDGEWHNLQDLAFDLKVTRAEAARLLQKLRFIRPVARKIIYDEGAQRLYQMAI
jgi:hypothetical protein